MSTTTLKREREKKSKSFGANKQIEELVKTLAMLVSIQDKTRLNKLVRSYLNNLLTV